MSNRLALDLRGLEIEPMEIGPVTDQISLESLVGGHAMAEAAASCQVCSCCVVCCCCC